MNDLRVWWIPQVPGKPFYVDVKSVEQGVLIMDTLAFYDIFQYENNIKPDYSNAGGLEMFDSDDKTDGPAGSWSNWYDEKFDFDDPKEYLEWLNDQTR